MISRVPWQLFQQWQAELDRLSRSPFQPEPPPGTDGASWVPPVDIREGPDLFLIRVDVPGVAPDHIQVAMEDGVLSISGDRPREEPEPRAFYRRLERPSGQFERRFSLPESADPSRVSASGTNGVLEVRIPKRGPTSRQRRVPVRGD